MSYTIYSVLDVTSTSFQKLMFLQTNKISFCLYTSLTVSRINAVSMQFSIQNKFRHVLKI